MVQPVPTKAVLHPAKACHDIRAKTVGNGTVSGN